MRTAISIGFVLALAAANAADLPQEPATADAVMGNLMERIMAINGRSIPVNSIPNEFKRDQQADSAAAAAALSGGSFAPADTFEHIGSEWDSWTGTIKEKWDGMFKRRQAAPVEKRTHEGDGKTHSSILSHSTHRANHAHETATTTATLTPHKADIKPAVATDSAIPPVAAVNIAAASHASVESEASLLVEEGPQTAVDVVGPPAGIVANAESTGPAVYHSVTAPAGVAYTAPTFVGFGIDRPTPTFTPKKRGHSVPEQFKRDLGGVNATVAGPGLAQLAQNGTTTFAKPSGHNNVKQHNPKQGVAAGIAAPSVNLASASYASVESEASLLVEEGPQTAVDVVGPPAGYVSPPATVDAVYHGISAPSGVAYTAPTFIGFGFDRPTPTFKPARMARMKRAVA